MTSIEALDRFYTERVPEQFNRTFERQRSAAEHDAEAARVFDEMRAVRTALLVEVRTGSAPRRFGFDVDRGRMQPCETPTHEPFLVLEHALDHFPALHRDCGDSILGLLGAVAGLPTDLRLTARRVRDLRILAGSVALERPGTSDLELLAHLGRREPAPRSRIRVPQDVFDRLRDGRLDPEQAFLDGLLSIEGDTELAIGFALALTAPD